MNKLRNFFALLILGLLCVLVLRASGPWSPRPRLWLGGEEITRGGVFSCGEGTAEYDPESGTLTLRDAVVEGDFRGALADGKREASGGAEVFGEEAGDVLGGGGPLPADGGGGGIAG